MAQHTGEIIIVLKTQFTLWDAIKLRIAGKAAQDLVDVLRKNNDD